MDADGGHPWWCPPQDLPYHRRTWRRTVGLLLVASLLPLLILAGGVLILAARVPPVPEGGTTATATRVAAVAIRTLTQIESLSAGALVLAVLVTVPAVLLVTGHLVQLLEEKRLRLGRLDRGLRRASRQASAQQLGLGLMGRLRDGLASIASEARVVEQLLAGGEEPPDPREAVAGLERLVREAGTCSDLIARYEGLTALPDGPVVEVDLDADCLVEDVLALFQWEFYLRRITLDRKREPTPPLARGDPALLRQVLQHLLLNAMQSIGRDGVILVATAAEARELRITVADSGHGIQERQLALVFEPLFTTRPDGVGLGLTVSRDLVERMGGRISVASQPGRGSSFTVHLPVRDAGGAPASAVARRHDHRP